MRVCVRARAIQFIKITKLGYWLGIASFAEVPPSTGTVAHRVES